MLDLGTHDWAEDPLFDSAIVRHGFAPHMRDYDVIVEVPASKPDGSGSYIEGRYRYRFTHCVEAHVATTITPETWKDSWSDEFIDRGAWEDAGCPSGFLWGVRCLDAYPGAKRLSDSASADSWSSALGRRMHEIEIKTNVVLIRLVCHDLRIDQLAVGDPATGHLPPIE